VVGGGPAGLSAAYYLALEGHKVTIFDSSPQLGVCPSNSFGAR
jgi:formate dehydrogenase major subunit